MGTAAKTSHTVTHGHTGTVAGSHTCYTQAQQARQHTLLHMDTAAETSHNVTHGHSGGDTRADRLGFFFFLKEVLSITDVIIIIARCHMAKYLRPPRQGLRRKLITRLMRSLGEMAETDHGLAMLP